MAVAKERAAGEVPAGAGEVGDRSLAASGAGADVATDADVVAVGNGSPTAAGNGSHAATANADAAATPARKAISDLANPLTFVASVLNTPPTVEYAAALCDTVRQLPQSEGASLMSRYWRYRESDVEAALDELRVDWARLFRGVSGPHGPRPPYELVYAPTEEGPYNGLGQLVRFYESYGVGLGDERHDRADYAGFELEFASLLAYDVAFGDLEPRDFALFSRRLSWLTSFCEEAFSYAETGFYMGFLVFLRDMAEELCAFDEI